MTNVHVQAIDRAAMQSAAEQDHAAEIAHLRAELIRQIGTAQSAVRRAVATIDRLKSDEIYDTEFEGEVYVEAFLLDAAKALAAAESLNPGRPRGEKLVE